jgi:hypothetical protein
VLVGAVETGFSHGLLIVAAPESVDAHNDWDPATELVHAGPDSLYIGVLDAAGGLVRVECYDEPVTDPSLLLLYRGDLELPSASVVLYDPNQQLRMIIGLEARLHTVVVLGNDDSAPTRLCIQFLEKPTGSRSA